MASAPPTNPTRYKVKATALQNGQPVLLLSDYLTNQHMQFSVEDATWVAGSLAMGVNSLLATMRQQGEQRRKQTAIVTPAGVARS